MHRIPEREAMAQKQFQAHDRTHHLPMVLLSTADPVPESTPVAAGQELVWVTNPVAPARFVEALYTLGLLLAWLCRLMTLCTVRPDNVSANPSSGTRGGELKYYQILTEIICHWHRSCPKPPYLFHSSIDPLASSLDNVCVKSAPLEPWTLAMRKPCETATLLFRCVS
jgi:hypothetical protein